MVAGVELDDGPARALSAGAVRRSGNREVVEVSMAEGRKREVRRMFAAVGLDVLDLVRTGFGPLRLGHLAGAGVRRLTRAEETALYASVGLMPPA
jgi:23S rRNA pseudouridine2605 synthase